MAASAPENRIAAGRRPAPRRRSAAGKAPSVWSAHLGAKCAVYGALFTAPLAAMLLLAFVWQMNAALQNWPAAGANAAPQYSAAGADNGGKLAFAHLPAAGNRPGPAARPAERDAKMRALGDHLRFAHKGLLVSSAAVLAAAAGCFMLLLYFIGREARFARACQNLQTQTGRILARKLRARTAGLEAARRLAEKERQRAELLLQDTSHRVGNSLATVSALLGLQLRQCRDEDVRRALLSARDRVQTISAAHRRLRLNQDMETAAADEFLSAVIQDVENSLNAEQRRQIRIETHFERWYLPARDVTTLGIILGELLTNAVKHAFPHGRPGRIYVAFGKMRAKNLRLIVEDDGIGLPAETLNPAAPRPAASALTVPSLAEKSGISAAAGQSQGLGRLILTQLAAQFDARPQYGRGKQGGCRIIIPLRKISAEPAAHPAKAAA